MEEEEEEAVVGPKKLVEGGDTFCRPGLDDLDEDLGSDPFDNSFKDPDYKEESRGQVLSSSSESDLELEESLPTFMVDGRKRKR